MTASAGLALDLVVAAAVIGLAVAVLFARERIVCVVFFLAFGLALALAWVRLDAPDVALAEAAIGTGLTGALLVDAVRRPGARRAQPGPDSARAWRAGARLLVGVALAVPLAVLLAVAAGSLGRTPGLGPAVDEGMPGTGVDHPVTAVLLDFRSYDTLLEVAVLLVAALAALVLQPGEDLQSVPVPQRAEPVVAMVVRVLVPVAVIVAGWLLVIGTSGPGGAFQAGALLAGVLVLLRLGGSASPAPGRRSLRLLLAAGTAVFLAVGAVTAAVGGGMLVLDPAWAKEAILAIEIALTVSIAVTLAELYVADQPAPAPRGRRSR